MTRFAVAAGPPRRLAAWFAVDGVGTAMWVAVSALYLTRSVGLSISTVGLGLAAAGAVGMALSVPIGRLADRCGLRRTALVLTAGQGVAMAAYAFLGHGLPQWAFAPVAMAFMICQRAGNSTRNGLLAMSVDGEHRLAVRATCRSLATAGGALGALATVPILGAQTRGAYLVAIGVNAASYLIGVLLVSRLPADVIVPRQPGARRWRALRDGRYVLAAGLVGLLSVHNSLLLVGLPLWIAVHTDVPHTIVGVVVATNTLLVVGLQVPLSRGIDGVDRATTALRRSGLLLGTACAGIAVTAWLGSVPAVVLILASVGVLTVGEILQSAGGWALSYDLAPADAHGEYQAVYSLGNGVRDTLGPPIATTAVALGGWGWLAAAALLLVVGWTFSLVRWRVPTTG